MSCWIYIGLLTDLTVFAGAGGEGLKRALLVDKVLWYFF